MVKKYPTVINDEFETIKIKSTENGTGWKSQNSRTKSYYSKKI